MLKASQTLDIKKFRMNLNWTRNLCANEPIVVISLASTHRSVNFSDVATSQETISYTVIPHNVPMHMLRFIGVALQKLALYVIVLLL